MIKFIKNVSLNNSNVASRQSIDESSDVEILDLDDDYDNLFLNGKYVDEVGNSFPAEYYYDSDGTYNAIYSDGNRNINVKFNVDGSKMSSKVVD